MARSRFNEFITAGINTFMGARQQFASQETNRLQQEMYRMQMEGYMPPNEQARLAQKIREEDALNAEARRLKQMEDELARRKAYYEGTPPPEGIYLTADYTPMSVGGRGASTKPTYTPTQTDRTIEDILGGMDTEGLTSDDIEYARILMAGLVTDEGFRPIMGEDGQPVIDPSKASPERARVYLRAVKIRQDPRLSWLYATDKDGKVAFVPGAEKFVYELASTFVPVEEIYELEEVNRFRRFLESKDIIPKRKKYFDFSGGVVEGINRGMGDFFESVLPGKKKGVLYPEQPPQSKRMVTKTFPY